MFTKVWLKDTAERVVATAAVVLLGAVGGTDAAAGHVSWSAVGWTVGLASLGTLLKCVIASRTGDPQSASLVQ